MFGSYVIQHYFCIRIRERTALQHDDELRASKNIFEKSFENIWKFKIKVLIFATAIKKTMRTSSLRNLHNIQQVVQVLRKLFPIDTVNI